MKKTYLLLTLFIVLLLNACGNSTPKGNSTTSGSNEDDASGAYIFKKYCAACHQVGGNGISGAFPPLRNNAVFKGGNNHLIQIVLKGMTGEVEVNGTKYNGVMVGFPNLNDKEIVDVINYIKKEMNSNTDFISEKEVLQIRNQ
jgi:mono/diheme cytochrome c family protein